MTEDIVKVILLSLIEGVTEFLPISSTGHLVLGTSVLNFDVIGSVFEIFIQFGAAVALIAYYRNSLASHARKARTVPAIRRFWLLVCLGCLPAAAFGLALGAHIEALLFTPQIVAVSLVFGGVVFLLVERNLPASVRSDDRSATILNITVRQAVVVGLIQALALIPGMSRSGSSIVGGMLAGMNRRLATEFSFFLAMPLLGGATLYRLADSLQALDSSQLFLLFLGATLSAIFAWFAIGWLVNFIARNSFLIFGYYRIAIGLFVLAVTSNG